MDDSDSKTSLNVSNLCVLLYVFYVRATVKSPCAFCPVLLYNALLLDKLFYLENE